MRSNAPHTKTLYVTDLDGTLLDADSKVDPITAQILSRLAEEGVMFTPATARTPATVHPLLHSVGQSYYTDNQGERRPIPAIVMTGGALWDRTARRFESCTLIPADDAQKIVDTFAHEALRPFIYCLSGDCFLNVYHPLAMSRRENAFYQERRHLELKRFHLDQNPSSLTSVALFFAIGPVKAIKQASHTLSEVTDCATAWYPDVIMPDTGLIDIYAPGVSKALAVKQMAKRVDASEVVVFGDNLNDLPMMGVATEAVAVDNALPQVKAAADTVIGPNTARSVARFIALREGVDITDLLPL